MMPLTDNKNYTSIIGIKEHREIYKRLFGGVKRQDLQLISARGRGKTLWLRMLYEKAEKQRKIAEDINEELCFSDFFTHSTVYCLWKLAAEKHMKIEELIQEIENGV